MAKQEKYECWFPQKKRLDERIGDPPSFNEREVWWCQLGVNIGYEIYGKGESFTRPVLVLWKHSNRMFLGVPLSTTEPKIKKHFPLRVDGKQAIARLDQLRTLDARRLVPRTGLIEKISPQVFASTRLELTNFLG